MSSSEYRLSAGELPELAGLIDSLGIGDYFKGDAVIKGADPLLQSPHKVATAASTALLLEAACAAAIYKFRTGKDNDISIDARDGLHQLHADHFVYQGQYNMDLGADRVKLNGSYQCKDGRHIWIQAGPPYPKLQDDYQTLFDCANTTESVQRAIGKWNSFELEEKLAEIGAPGAVARSPEEWRAHPQGIALSQAPVVEIIKIADGDPVGLQQDGNSPLENVKVLDLTHVLAGPRSSMDLAEFGANVLHVAPPHHLDPKTINLGVNHGKRSTFLDLREAAELKKMYELVNQTDVFSCSYRPSVLDRFGLNAPDLLKLNNKGIVCLSVNCYGHQGPWKDRAGFDQVAQTATGFCYEEGGSFDNLKTSPVYYMNDLLTAFFAASGVMAALLRRATEGGSYQVNVSLSRSCMWTQDFGLVPADAYRSMPEKDLYPHRLSHDPKDYTYFPNYREEDSCFGQITRLAPPFMFTNMPEPPMLPCVPYGSYPPEFW